MEGRLPTKDRPAPAKFAREGCTPNRKKPKGELPPSFLILFVNHMRIQDYSDFHFDHAQAPLKKRTGVKEQPPIRGHPGSLPSL